MRQLWRWVVPFKVVFTDHTLKLGPLVAEWYKEKTGSEITPPYALAAILDQEYNIQGVVWYYDYQPQGNVDIHIYTPGCFTRNVIRVVYSIAFNGLGCTRITAKVARSNKKLLKLMPRLGFVYEFTQKRYFKDEDAIVHVLFRENITDAWTQNTKS